MNRWGDSTEEVGKRVIKLVRVQLAELEGQRLGRVEIEGEKTVYASSTGHYSCCGRARVWHLVEGRHIEGRTPRSPALGGESTLEFAVYHDSIYRVC